MLYLFIFQNIQFSNSANIIKIAVILAAGISCSVQDYKEQKVSDIKIFLSSLIILICNFFLKNWYLYIISSIIMFAVYYSTKKIMKYKLGKGDIYFAVLIGLSLLPDKAVLSIIISVVLSGLYFGIIKIAKKKEQKQIAFIPFMTASLFICYFIQIIKPGI